MQKSVSQMKSSLGQNQTEIAPNELELFDLKFSGTNSC